MAPRDQDKVSARLLRQSLRDSGDACPEPESLAAYFDRSLDGEETARYERHFSQCARCREQLAAMDRAAEHVLVGRSDTRQAARWARLWDWRTLAPVAVVLVVAVLWIAHRPTTSKLAEMKTPSPLVAMNGPSEQAAAPQAAPESKVATPNMSSIEEQAVKRERKAGVAQKHYQAQDELQLDKLKEEEGVVKQGSGTGNGIGAAIGGAASSTGAPAAPPPAPPALVADTSGVPAASAQRVTVESAVQPASAPIKAKSAASANYESALTQQTQTVQVQAQTLTQAQAALQPQTVTLEALEKRSTGNIITTPDPKVLWRIVAGTSVELSKDRGATWKKQQLRSFEPNPQITVGYAPTAKICWLVGRDGVIILTRDAAHWVPIPPPVNTDFVGVTAQDNFSATVTTADGRKFSTDDAGDHWNPAP